MRNLCMVVSYDGTSYYGFQSQPQKNTIQDKIEAAIEMLTGEKVKIVSSGRTDAGVHARGQVFNFLTSSPIPVKNWCLALNSRLPKDIVVRQAREVPLDFHSRRWAKRKTYCYTINNNRYIDVFHKHIQFHHPVKLDIEQMEEALKCVLGEHDFTSFCSRKSNKPSHVRTILEARIVRERSRDPSDSPDYTGVFHIYITGNGFLYNMVRIIAGTLIQIGEGKRAGKDMLGILQARDRSQAGPTAEPHGLVLWDVSYDV
jgi:tRNA pseudouridine38-40 synthase